MCKKKLLRIINVLICYEGILLSVCIERGSPKVSLTGRAPCTGVSHGQRAMEFVTFVLYDFSKQRIIDLLPSTK